jgi:hypothetical protein
MGHLVRKLLWSRDLRSSHVKHGGDQAIERVYCERRVAGMYLLAAPLMLDEMPVHLCWVKMLAFWEKKMLVATSHVEHFSCLCFGRGEWAKSEDSSHLLSLAWKNWSVLDPALVLLRVLSYVGLNIIQVSGVVPHHLWSSKIRSFLYHALRTELLLVSWLAIMI